MLGPSLHSQKKTRARVSFLFFVNGRPLRASRAPRSESPASRIARRGADLLLRSAEQPGGGRAEARRRGPGLAGGDWGAGGLRPGAGGRSGPEDGVAVLGPRVQVGASFGVFHRGKYPFFRGIWRVLNGFCGISTRENALLRG